MAVQPGFDAAWTDAVLTACALGGAFAVRGRARWLAPVGVGLVGLAAFVGTFRLGGLEVLGPLHDGLSRLAGAVGVPLAGLGLAVQDWSADRLRPVWIGAGAGALAMGLVHLLAPVGAAELARTAVAAVALLAGIAVSARSRNPAGVVGPVVLLVTGLVVAGDGVWLGFDRDGWFHLGMALACALIAFAARERP